MANDSNVPDGWSRGWKIALHGLRQGSKIALHDWPRWPKCAVRSPWLKLFLGGLPIVVLYVVAILFAQSDPDSTIVTLLLAGFGAMITAVLVVVAELTNVPDQHRGYLVGVLVVLFVLVLAVSLWAAKGDNEAGQAMGIAFMTGVPVGGYALFMKWWLSKGTDQSTHGE